MAKCPDCGATFESPRGRPLLTDEFLDPEETGASVSVQQHIQAECPECGAILGYLGMAAATGD